VPPLMAAALATEVRAVLDRYYENASERTDLRAHALSARP
jgi:hypothetical protein